MLRLSGTTLVLLVAMALAVVAAEPPPVWWSFQPLARSAIPQPASANPIDAFIHAKLQEKGLSSSPEADRRTLIRRVSFDLTGLPPTPDELKAFLADRSPDAYEKLVDRLLATPAYGERMARLWMDAVHFAETHGHDQDRVRPNAWRYRDYLISAFNADTPYSRFVREQVATDVLYPDRPELTPALGFLAAGPWDESSLRDIREDTLDREVGRYLDRDDIVSTVMNTFQGLTVQCARCHDHKFDPIPQEEYYRLQAVFAGVGRGDVAYDANPTIGRKRRELKDTLAAIERNDPALKDRLTAAAFKKQVAQWEARHPDAGTIWETPKLVRLESAEGSKLSRLPDGSVRSEGKRPERDTYTLGIRVKGKRLTALRLELLVDESLPHGGPGRQDNGNLHLSEFSLAAAAMKDGVAGPFRNVILRNPTSDYDQPGWTVAHAIDGNPKTAWGIYPQVGRPHEAVFELAEPLPADRESELTIRLDQLHGGGHLIGRLRLSITSANMPVKVSPIPPAIRGILATRSADRTPQQAHDLALHVLHEQADSALAALPPEAKVYAAAASFAPDGSHKPTAMPRPVRILKRGDIRRPGPLVEPGAVSCLPGISSRFELEEKSTDSDRRGALAKWLSDAKNPLTWRVMANRIWQYHFGRGLVDSPNDFGKMGQKPTHPELLDYLAAELRDHQSLKKLHKLIVTSAAYKQVSASRAEAAKIDADNRLLWRQNRTRLDAEQVRDAILMVSGRLDRKSGGPSDQQFAMKPGIHVTPLVDYGKFDWDRPQGHRRSVYRFNFRTLPDPLVSCLDGAEASQLTPKRTESVTALQALSLLNNEFVLVHAKAIATQLEKQEADPRKRILLACELVWARPPGDGEQEKLAEYTSKHGLANLCRVLLNTNEFLFAE